ncbi:hypothetical protein HDU89_001982 [Geranomyces variabilis]|nr:hypothetical protein HDU89_001982 [Geranomyces variabilis]
MSSTADASSKARNLDETSSNEQQIAELYKLIDGIETAMLTTRNSNGQLVSRAMQTRQRVAGADIWFVTNIKSHKLDDLHFDSNVNVAYYKPSTSDWVSVSGTATISQDKAKIAELYQPDLKAWFGDLGDGIHNGEVNDPRIALVFVKAESVHYQMQNKSTPRVLFEIVRGSLTGERPAVGPLRELGASELATARASGLPKTITVGTSGTRSKMSSSDPKVLLFTWNDLYTASYGTSLFLTLVLVATFAEGILAVKSRASRIAFWTAVTSSIIRLAIGSIFVLIESRPLQILIEFIWALLSSLERYCIARMLYDRTVVALWPVRVRWLVFGELATFGVFVVSCADYFWYAVSTIHGYDSANYSMPLGLLDSIYLMILDSFFFFNLTKTLRSQNRVLLSSGKIDFVSLSFEVAQIIRMGIFLLLEAMACYLTTSLQTYSATVQLALTVGSCTRPFLAITDMGRARGIEISISQSHRRIDSLETRTEEAKLEKKRSIRQSTKATGVLSDPLLPEV